MTPPPQTLEERLERLVAAGTELSAEFSLQRVLQRVADISAELLGARYAAVGLLAPDNRTLQSFTTSGITPEDRARIGDPPTGRGILGLLVHKGIGIRMADLTQHPASVGFPPHHPRMTTFLGVPITGKRGVIGDLYLTEKLGGGPFTDEDEHLAGLLAARAGAAIDNATLHEESARLLEEVQQLHRTRERFFAMVNHELRNALAAVYGWAEMLVRRKPPQEVPRAAFEILDSAEQAVSLINDLLDLSRLDEHRLKVTLQDVDCASIVVQAILRVTPAAESRRVRLLTAVPPHLPVCRADPHRVEQILVNLLGNAIRHTPEDTEVTVGLRHEAPYIEFSIRDKGPGVTPDDAERVFDIYVTTAGEERQGTGLGLPLSRRLARLLGGELVVISEPAGGGHFVLRLPASAGLKTSSQ